MFSRGNEDGAVSKNREVVEDLINLFKGTAYTEVQKHRQVRDAGRRPGRLEPGG